MNWLLEMARGSAGRLVGGMLAVLALLLLTRWARRAATSIAEPAARYRTRKLIGGGGALMITLILGAAFSDSLSSLPVLLGVTAAGIALALQEVIMSVASWLAIASGRVYRPGDRVELGGVKGDVIDIGVLRTTLMEIGQWVDSDLYSGRMVKVANSAAFKQPVFNYTQGFPFVWDEIKVPVHYGSDRLQARRLLERAAAEVAGAYVAEARRAWATLVEKYLIDNASVEPIVSLVANDNWLEYTVRYAVDARERRAIRDRLFSRILELIDSSGGAVAVASATLRLMPPDLPGASGPAASVTQPAPAAQPGGKSFAGSAAGPS